MCAHAAAASLYLSLFSLLGVDISAKKRKKKIHDKLVKGHKFFRIAAAYGTKEWGDSFFHSMSEEELEASAT